MNKNEYCATERLYLNSEGKAVGADEADRQSLLLVPGQCIPLDKARTYGLVNDVEPEPVVEPEVKAQPKPPSTKAVLSVPQNKGKK